MESSIPEHTMYLLIRDPIVTGSSVIGIKYKDGVILAAPLGA